MLYGISKFPKSIDGLYVEFGLIHGDGDQSFSEKEFMSFTLSEEKFIWDHANHVYEAGVGGDSLSRSSFEIYLEGSTNSYNIDIDLIRNYFDELYQMGAKFYFEDMSVIDCDDLKKYEEE